MARASVLKRQRERKRDEKAAQKREGRTQRDADRPEGADPLVATDDDLAGYGLAPEPAGSSSDDGDDRGR